MDSMESYSVLMSVYAKEQAAYFKESIHSMLAQSVRTDDFVIVCDGPLNEALDQVINEVTTQYPALFQIIRLPENQGLGNALREGLSYCKHDLIARMDSDDISVKDRCKWQLQAFEEQKADIVGGNIEEFTTDIEHPKAKRQVPQTDRQIKAFAKRRNPFNHPTVMFRKSSVEAAGGYLECRYFEDYYLWARMLHQGMTGYNIQKTLVYMRTNAGMYERRGSFSYALLGFSARYKIHKIGFSSTADFLISAGGQIVMSIIPVKIRTYFYGKFLRK